MNQVKLPMIELALIAGTRVSLGVGLGLLIASQLTRPQRRAAGMALAAFGGLTTIPLVMDVVRRKRKLHDQASRPHASLACQEAV